VAAALWTDEDLEAGVQLDCIVTVVDAINIDRQLNDKREDGVANEAQVQVAYADIILLNKVNELGM
jgi:G3E family GTPase